MEDGGDRKEDVCKSRHGVCDRLKSRAGAYRAPSPGERTGHHATARASRGAALLSILRISLDLHIGFGPCPAPFFPHNRNDGQHAAPPKIIGDRPVFTGRDYGLRFTAHADTDIVHVHVRQTSKDGSFDTART